MILRSLGRAGGLNEVFDWALLIKGDFLVVFRLNCAVFGGLFCSGEAFLQAL